MTIRTIAVLYPGAMGASLARVLRRTQPGLTLLTSLQGRSGATARRAADVGLEDVPLPELVRRSDLILSILPPSSAVRLAKEVADVLASEPTALTTDSEAHPNIGHAHAPGKQLSYIDANAISPETVSEVSSILTPHGVVFLDGCVIGLPATPDLSFIPKLYLSATEGNEEVLKEVTEVLSGSASSGSARTEGQDLEAGNIGRTGAHAGDEPVKPTGLVVRPMYGAGEGGASALKMCYGGINKGIIGLATIIILSAQAHSPGTAHALLAELAESKPALVRQLGSSLPDMVPKAYRWVGEMEEISSFISSSLSLSDLNPAGAKDNGREDNTERAEGTRPPNPADTFAGLAQVFQRVADDLRSGSEAGSTGGVGGQAVKALLEWAEDGKAVLAQKEA